MRIRTIKPEFFTHEDLAELPPVTRLAFAGLWCAADREGRFQWREKKLKIQILPWDDVDFSQILNDLLQAGFLVKYQVEGKDYGWIPTFHLHQRVQTREMQSTIPAPPFPVNALQVQCTGTAGAMQGHCSAEGEGNREGNRERNRNNTPKPPKGADVEHPQELQRILMIFRKRKEGTITRKLDAQEEAAWKKIQGTIQADDLEQVERFYSEPKSAACDQTWKRKMAPAQLMNQWNSQVDLAGAFYEGKEDAHEW
jgi:hypothetical protein